MLGLTKSEFLTILPPEVRPEALYQRRQRGEVMLAYGRTSREHGYDWLDPIAIRITEALATRTRVSLSEAARLTAETFPAWSAGVSVAETYPAGERPLGEQIHLVVADVGDAFITKIGDLAGVLKDLPANTKVVHAISIDQLLADLYADAERVGVTLPAKLTPAFGSDAYLAWRKTIDDDAALDATRAFAAAKKKKTDRAAALEAEAKALREEVATLLARQADLSRDHRDIHDALDALAKSKKSSPRRGAKK
jgi:nucleoid-associated protein YgaU